MKQIVKILLISLFLSSCSQKIAFTSSMQSEYKFTEEKLKKVQFYTSEEIVLVQTKNDEDAVVENGKIVFRNQKEVERIIIPRNTPCVLEKVVDTNKFLFSFEYGANRVLLFGNNSEGFYSLMAKEWKNKVGEVKYTDKKYLTVNGDVFLLIKAKTFRKLKGRQRQVKGRKV